jgi:hypothetical protein
MLPSSCEGGSSIAIIEVDPRAVRSMLEPPADDAGAEPLAIDHGAVRSTFEPLTIDAGAGRKSLEPPDLADV